MYPYHFLLGLGNTIRPMKLFQDSPGTAGIVVLVLFCLVIVGSSIFALVRYIRRKRLEQLPMILGNSKKMLETLGYLLDLSFSDKQNQFFCYYQC